MKGDILGPVTFLGPLRSSPPWDFSIRFFWKHQRRIKSWKSCWLWHRIFTKITPCRLCQTSYHFPNTYCSNILRSVSFCLLPLCNKNFPEIKKKIFPLPVDLLDIIYRITVSVGQSSGNFIGLPIIIAIIIIIVI